MFAFLLLFGVFYDTVPRRHFTLPVSSLRLVAVPVLAGIASIELLFLFWLEPVSKNGSTSPLFVGVLLAAFMVFYLAVLWTCQRTGSLRLVIVGLVAVATLTVGLLPSFPPAPPPVWRSEAVLASLVSALAAAAFTRAWAHVARDRAGGGTGHVRLRSLAVWIAEAVPARRTPFGSPAAAQFWFEWRSSGMVLPALVVAIVLAVALPMSWVMRNDAGNTLRLLLATLAAPIVLAIPVGTGFSKPTFWSEDLSVPAFVAVRPVSAEDLVAAKLKVAAMSTVLSWISLLAMVTVWLSSWANLDALSRLAIQLWAFHEWSARAVYGIAILVVVSGMFLTWRFLVSRLWSGMSGKRPRFVVSAVSIAVLAIAGLVFDADRLPGWLLRDPVRLAPVAWIAAAAVIAKYWIAAYTWRDIASRYVRVYLVVWFAGTVSLLALGLVVWRMVSIYVALDVDRLRSIVVLTALLAMPLARVGLAPSQLARNRHRAS